MSNLRECYSRDARFCAKCFNNNDQNDVFQSENETDWPKMRERFSSLGITNYISNRHGTAIDRDIIGGENQTMRVLGLRTPPENGDSDPYPTENLCVCPLAKYTPEEWDTVPQEEPPERFDSILIHGNRANAGDLDEKEMQCNSPQAEILEENSSRQSTSKRKNNEHQLSADVSLWDLRKSFESTSVSCSDPASLDDDSTPRVSSPETIRKRDNKCETQNTKKESIVNQATSEECDNEIIVLNDSSNQNTPTRRANHKVSHTPRKSIHTLRDVRKKCKWFSKTCYDSPVDDDIELQPRNLNLSRTTAIVENCSRDGSDRSKDGKTQMKLLSPTRDQTISSGIPIPGESSSCSITPDSISSESASKQTTNSFPQDDTTSNESSEASSKSPKSDSIQNLTRIFRRSHFKHRVPSPSFCGYSLERDYCVDVQTDRIFKEFLKPDPSMTSDRTSCFRRPPSCRSKTATQLRRQVMRKQYSDSVAVYYGQRMRRWRVKKQRSDSVNCPVDRAVLRRQEQIDEEYYPNDLEEISNTSRDSRILPEQNEHTRSRKFRYRSQSTDVDP
uniref:uncharacterized protein LOC120340160 n=1 Tax=Styela clava TaxID=7725 RepID=UPI001939749B|nr:uncharacterized protein LOC120340160 [Styela clava]